ncbi:MAG: hypothetical protein ABL883_14360 [Terricaulis sp.]
MTTAFDGTARGFGFAVDEGEEEARRAVGLAPSALPILHAVEREDVTACQRRR